MNANNHNTGIAIDANQATVVAAIPAETLPSTVPKMSVLAAKIATSFLSRESDALLIGSTARCVDGLTGNAYFPETLPPLAEVVATRNAYVLAVGALNRSKESLALRDAARLTLVKLMRELALFLQQKSGGDKVKLLTTNFPLQKERRPEVAAPPPPGGVRLRRTRLSTQLVARCDRVPLARTYQWRYATGDAPTVWTMPDANGSTRFVLDAVVPGTVYIVQVRAFNRRGAGDWSDVATLMAA